MINLDHLNSYISEDLKSVNDYISSVIQPDFANDIVKNICFGGKRIRPIILILLANILGGRRKRDVALAASGVELMHLASLMHDDVIDSGLKRHDQTTAHILFSNQKAILGGDFLFAESFKTMVLLKNIEILKIIANVSSVLVSGELIQMHAKNSSLLSEEEYFNIIHKKTASLFIASAEIASIIQSEVVIFEVSEFGKNAGIAFQIIDDLIDYKSINSKKEQGADFYESKQTLPLIFALSKKSTLNDLEKNTLKNLFFKSEKQKEDLQIVISLIEKAEGFTYTKNVAQSFCLQAKQNILAFTKGEVTHEVKLIFDIIHFFESRVF